MRKRNVSFVIRLDKKEAQNLEKKVKKSGLNRESYVRLLINGITPKEKPSADFYTMLRELRQIGNSLNQIALKANTIGVIDAIRYQKNYRMLETAIGKIMKAVYS